MNSAEKDFIVAYLRGTQRRFKPGADEGTLKIVEYGLRNAVSTADIAYLLATSWHETAQWMQPIREGCSRTGPAGTDKQARAAVQAAINKGLIKKNYLIPTAGVYHYGRGLVQITWADNYGKFEAMTGLPLKAQPDLALQWDASLTILYRGCLDGMFTGKKLSQYYLKNPLKSQYASARAVVNGDVRKNGNLIAGEAMIWYSYLQKHRIALEASYGYEEGLNE